MKTQHLDVYNRCMTLANELETKEELENSLAILRALQTYLDVFPASADGSCRHAVMYSIDRVGTLVRQQARTESKGW